MAIAILVVLLLSPAPVDGAAPLAALLDSPDEAVRRAATLAIDAEGFDALALLDSVGRRVRTAEGRGSVESLFAARRAQLRALARSRGAPVPRELLDALRAAPAAALWRAGAGIGEDGALVVHFDARTFPRGGSMTRGDWDRLRVLEYLVCVEPPEGGVVSKDYEALAGMRPAEWSAFRAQLPGSPRLRLRWRRADGALADVALTRALPGAKVEANELGVTLGGNRDERGNASLPPDETEIQVGIEIPCGPR